MVITVPACHDAGIASGMELITVRLLPDTITASAVTLTDAGPVEARSSPAVPDVVPPTSGAAHQFSERGSPLTSAPCG